MIPALLTTLLWSVCIVAARRSVDYLGENAANFWRLALAVCSLGLLSHVWGHGMGGAGFWYFFLGGIIGFGLGDIGGFYALPRIGSRLTVLLAQCGAAPVAGLGEWLWLGTAIRPLQMVAISVILLGLVIALWPDKGPKVDRRTLWIGIAFGALAGLGQGWGAVFSRKAYAVMQAAGEPVATGDVWSSIITGANAGYQRQLGGILVVGGFWLISAFYRPWQTQPREPGAGWGRIGSTVVLNALTGPIVGIICFQWALATTPSAIVQPIVAMTPLVVIPIAYWFEGDRPKARSLVGALVSVAGAILLTL